MPHETMISFFVTRKHQKREKKVTDGDIETSDDVPETHQSDEKLFLLPFYSRAINFHMIP